jgi:hypothetical protein
MTQPSLDPADPDARPATPSAADQAPATRRAHHSFSVSAPAGEEAALRQAIDTIGRIGELADTAPARRSHTLPDLLDRYVWQTKVLMLGRLIMGTLVGQAPPRPPAREPLAEASRRRSPPP